jgi:hypothetical protein
LFIQEEDSMTTAKWEAGGLRLPVLQGVLPIKGAQMPTEVIAGITLAALANLGAGLSGTFVVNGSPTKTQMVDSAGGHSQLAQITTIVIVLLVLLFLTGPLGRRQSRVGTTRAHRTRRRGRVLCNGRRSFERLSSGDGVWRRAKAMRRGLGVVKEMEVTGRHGGRPYIGRGHLPVSVS